MPSWLLRHSTPHLWTRFSDEGFKTFLGGGYVTTLITGIFLSGIGKIFLFLRGRGEDCVDTFDLVFSQGRSQLTSSIGRGGGEGSVVAIKCFFP